MTARRDTSRDHDDAWRRLEAVIDQFEHRWHKQSEPVIAEFLPPLGHEERLGLLRELIKVDLEYRWDRGQQPRVEEYLRQFPELVGVDGLTEDLLQEEIAVRGYHGSAPTEAELQERFPGRNHPSGQTPPARSTLRPSASQPLKRLGRYQLYEHLGRGGFATVYRAWDPELRREVAVKVPHPELQADPSARARLLREATSVARLRHPAIVPIHEASCAGDLTYIVYQLIPGPTLAEVLKQTRPSPQQSALWVARIAEALAYAHANGIVHRDVKPGNILMDQDGQPMLADFGLAQQFEASARLTQEGDILGTPAYMAPEQAAGQAQTVDGRTDVYSLGVLLYELLVGQLPFAGSVASVLHQVQHQEPAPPRRHRPEIPADLETICLKAMSKEPWRRYATAQEMATDLRNSLEHRPIQARRVGPMGRLVRWCRRKPALAATITVAVLTVGIVAGVAFWQVVEERDRFRLERDRAQANLYRALVSDALAQMQGRDTGWWWKAMEDIREAGRLDVSARDPAELRQLAIRCMGTGYPCFRLLAAWEGHTGPVTAVALSPDGARAVSGSRDQTVRLWSVADGQLLAVLSGHTKPVTGVAFHPDGRKIASGSSDGAVRIWEIKDLDSKTIVVEGPRILDLQAGAVRAVEFSPDGAWLAAACEDGTIRQVSTTNPTRSRVLTGHSGPVYCLTYWSAGVPRDANSRGSLGTQAFGELLFSGSADRTIRVWDAATGRQTHSWAVAYTPSALAFGDPLQGLGCSSMETLHFEWRYLTSGDVVVNELAHTAAISQLRALPRKGLWLTASRDGTLKAWAATRRASAREFAVARIEAGAVLSTAVGPEGNRVVAGYADGRVRLWELHDPPQRTIVRSGFPCAEFLAGRLLASADQVFDFTKGLQGPRRSFGPSAVRCLAIHPSGSQFVFATDEGGLHLWERDQRRERLRWSGHGQRVSAVAWDPDGGRLASASWDGTVKLWQSQTGRLDQTLEAGLGALHAVAWSLDGRHLAAAGDAGVVLWDLKAGPTPQRLSGHTAAVAGVAFGPGTLAHSAANGTVEVRDLATGRVRHTLRGHTADVYVVAFSPGGHRLASASADGTLRIWDSATGQERMVLSLEKPVPKSLAFHPEGRYLVSSDHVTLVWDLQTDRAIARLMGGGGGPVGFTGDGSEFLLGSHQGAVQSCSLAEIEQARAAVQGTEHKATPVGPARVDLTTLIVPGGHMDTVWGMATSPDGRWLATASHDRTVNLWDARTLELVRTLQGHGGPVWCIAFSPDSRYLASGSVGGKTGQVKVWETATGRLHHDFVGHERLVAAVAFHPTHPWLVSSSFDGSVRLWDLSAGQPLGLLHQFDGLVAGLAFRPDGRTLAAACQDHRVALWDFAEPPTLPSPPRHTLEGHTSGVWSVRFSPDGRYLASGADHGLAILWDGETLERIVTLPGNEGQIRSISFSHDGGLLSLTTYMAGTLVWDLEHLHRTLREMDLDWEP